jgi:uncharacterized protein YlxP (DUF503 family)
MDLHDSWQEAILACAMVSNDHKHVHRSLQKISHWIETSWPDVTLLDEQVEII